MDETLLFNADLKLPLEKALRVSDTYDSDDALRCLSRSIARYPHNLRAHTQRILLATDKTYNDYLPGAFQDLSIALAGKGKPFFAHLLDMAKPALSDDAYTLIMEGFENHHEYSQCWNKGSVLANGVCNGEKLVAYSGSEIVGFESVLDEARSYIEYGQIEEAQGLLEQELLANPDSSEIAEELLNLYQYMRNRDALTEITKKLDELGIELSAEWTQCLEEADSW